MTLPVRLILSIAFPSPIAVAVLWLHHGSNSDIGALQVLPIVARYMIEDFGNAWVFALLLARIIFGSANPSQEIDVYEEGGAKSSTTTRYALGSIAIFFILIVLIGVTNDGVKSRLAAASIAQ